MDLHYPPLFMWLRLALQQGPVEVHLAFSLQ